MTGSSWRAVVDPGILPIVDLLNETGFKTFASCEGGGEVGAPTGSDTNEHSRWAPWIRLHYSSFEDASIQYYLDKLVDCLRSNQYYGFTVSYNQTYHSRDRDSLTPYVEVEFFAPVNALPDPPTHDSRPKETVD